MKPSKAEACLSLHVRENEDFGLPKEKAGPAPTEQACAICGSTSNVTRCPRCFRYFCREAA